jgi:hypothetical protein
LENACSELSTYESVTQLYDTVEHLYGAQAKRDFESNAKKAVDPTSKDSEAAHSQPREAMAALGLRYAIENVLKFGRAEGRVPTNSELGRLWAIGARILQLDQFLEHVHLGMIEHAAVVTDTLRLGLMVTRAGDDAFQSFQTEFNKIWQKREIEKILDHHDHPFKWIPENELTDSENWRRFDPAFKEELGYSLTEWFQLMTALMRMFGPTQYLIDIDRRSFIETAKKETRLRRQKLELILGDLILTQEKLKSRNRRELLPAENFWRDERMTNRPLIEVGRSSERRILWGVELLSKSMLLSFQRLNGGNRVFPGRTSENGPIARVAGRINEASGDQLRDYLQEHLTEAGYNSTPEKKTIAGVLGSCPPGPIDLFVIDRQKQRMILVEVKDLSFRLTPTEWKWERKDYLFEGEPPGYLKRLHSKRDWFEKHRDQLTRESGLVPEAELDALVVSGMPSMWVFCSAEPLPILHFDAFLEKLKSGEPLRSNPMRFGSAN